MPQPPAPPPPDRQNDGPDAVEDQRQDHQPHEGSRCAHHHPLGRRENKLLADEERGTADQPRLNRPEASFAEARPAGPGEARPLPCTGGPKKLARWGTAAS